MLLLGLGAEQATHTVSVALLLSMHTSHSQEPRGGAHCALRAALAMEGGAEGLEAAPDAAGLAIKPHSGDDDDDEVAEGFGLRQAAHFNKSGLLLMQQTSQVQEPGGGAS